MHLVGIDYLETHDDPQFESLTIGFDDHDRGYIYAQVHNSRDIAQYNAAVLGARSLLTPSHTTSGAGSLVGVAPVTMARNRWGWLQIAGACTLLVKANCAAYTQLWTNATYGALEDASTSGADQIDSGIFTTEARGGTDGTVAAMLLFPRVTV